MKDIKYPIGKPTYPSDATTEHVEYWISILENFPQKLTVLVGHLTDKQLDTRYRDGGWTIRQVVHHCADSHQNSYTRFKWAMTENRPIIKAYYEDKWADLVDSKTAPISLSLDVLKALHAKWVYFLKTLSMDDLETYFIHPEGFEKVSLKENIYLYTWHCKHHYAHIENLMRERGW